MRPPQLHYLPRNLCHRLFAMSEVNRAGHVNTSELSASCEWETKHLKGMRGYCHPYLQHLP